MNTLVERQARAAAGSEPLPGPAEALFLANAFLWLAGVSAGMAVALAWARYWRVV